MLKRSPRRKPTRVNPKSRASATARLLGADTAQKMGAPATRHFCRSSNLDRLQACLAADTTGARGVKMPFQRNEVRQRVAAELHVHDVVLLIGIDLRIETVGDPGELIARLKDTFSEQEATGQFEVGTRR